jgi:hypothetical protein
MRFKNRAQHISVDHAYVRGHRLTMAQCCALGRTPCARMAKAGWPSLPWLWPGVAGHRGRGSPAAGLASAAARLPLCPTLPGVVAASASPSSTLWLPLLVSSASRTWARSCFCDAIASRHVRAMAAATLPVQPKPLPPRA